MTIELHPRFKKSYQKRISSNPKLIKQVQERIKMFSENPNNRLLRSHQLMGSKGKLRSFSVTGDIRIIYLENSPNRVTFLDIGSHNQVY